MLKYIIAGFVAVKVVGFGVYQFLGAEEVDEKLSKRVIKLASEDASHLRNDIVSAYGPCFEKHVGTGVSPLVPEFFAHGYADTMEYAAEHGTGLPKEQVEEFAQKTLERQLERAEKLQKQLEEEGNDVEAAAYFAFEMYDTADANGPVTNCVNKRVIKAMKKRGKSEPAKEAASTEKSNALSASNAVVIDEETAKHQSSTSVVKAAFSKGDKPTAKKVDEPQERPQTPLNTPKTDFNFTMANLRGSN